MQHSQPRGKSRAVATVIGAVLLALALMALIGFYVNSLRQQTRVAQIASGAVENKLSTMLLTSGMTGYYNVSNDNLYIYVNSTAPRTVLITGLVILWDDGSMTLIDRNNGSLAPLGVTVTVSHANGPDTFVDRFPIHLAPGDTLNITLAGYASGRSPSSISAASSSTSAVAVIPIHHYTEMVPGNITIIEQPVELPSFYRIVPRDFPLLDGYTVAVPATINAISTINDTYAQSYTIVAGSHLGGDVDDTRSRDGNTLQVEAQASYRCLGTDWRYYKEVTITNTHGVTYNNIVARIDLTSSNFNFSHARSDGSDIRITLEDCTELPFWIEKWDAGAEQATIWVRIPTLPPGETRLLLLYGNPSASSASDLRATFIFGEDLEVDYNGDSVINNNDMLYVGWNIVSETNGLWHVAGPGTCASIDHNWYYGRDSSCNYDVGITRGYISTPLIELPSLESGSSLMLRFYTRWYVEVSNGWDVRYVDISNDNGATWSNVWVNSAGTGSPVDWHWEQADISSYAGQDVRLRFRFDSGDDCCNSYEGWHVDNIIIAKIVADITVTVGSENSNKAYAAILRLNYPYVETLYRIRVYANANTSSTLDYVVRVLDSSLAVRYTRSGSFSSTLEIDDFPRDTVNSSLYLVIKILSNDAGFIIGVDEAVISNAGHSIASGLLIANSGNAADRLAFFNPDTNTTTIIYIPSYLLGLPSNYTVLAPEPISMGGWIWVARHTTAISYDAASDTWRNDSSITLDEPVAPGAVLAANGTHLYYCPGNGSSTLYIYFENGTLQDALTLPVAVTAYSGYAVCGDTLYIHTGSTGRLIALNLTSATILYTIETPVLYTTGVDCDGERIWIMPKGGGLVYYNLTTGEWEAPRTVSPYAPLEPGDRLVVTTDKLYHVREDGTNELLVLTKPS